MKFLIECGCLDERIYMAVEAENFHSAADFAKGYALEIWKNNETLKNNREIKPFTDLWWSIIYEEIIYRVEFFDKANLFHLNLLNEQNGFFII